MTRQIVTFLVFAWLLVDGPLRADGLIFQLPPDGTWARYAMTTEAQFKLKGTTQKISVAQTLTVSSVGEVTRNEQKCRWLELKMESQTRGVYPKLLLKILVPEDYLRRGEDPLSHAVLTFFDPKPADRLTKAPPSVESFIDEGFNRIQYEIDRFRPVFPKPLDDSKKLKPEAIETRAGRFEGCEVVAGTSRYDGPLLNDGRSVFKGTYRLLLNPKAPFGVVAMHADSEAAEIGQRGRTALTAKTTLSLAESGKNAVSELPQGAVKKTKPDTGPHNRAK